MTLLMKSLQGVGGKGPAYHDSGNGASGACCAACLFSTAGHLMRTTAGLQPVRLGIELGI